MYKVVKAFRDLKDNERLYRVGDKYPVSGMKVSKARLEELASGKNPLGEVFIEKVSEPTDKESDE